MELSSKPVPDPATNSMPDSGLPPAVEAFYTSELGQIRQAFETTGDGAAYLRERAERVDSVVAQLYKALFSTNLHGPAGFCVVAVGGYGRQELFPFSDVDLLFLGNNAAVLQSLREPIATLARNLWDLRMHVGHSTRTLAECGQLHTDNLEFTVSLLDARWLAGDTELFGTLRSHTLLHLVARDRQDLIRNLVQITHDRHAKHGRTIFHLEPNIKDAPGGLRDYHVARWLSVISEAAEHGRWKNPEEGWPHDLREKVKPAFRFLASLRCLLHFDRGRDDNLLSYELQEKAAAAGLGVSYGRPVDPSQWMRAYFLHVRSIHRLVTRLLEEATPPRASLYGIFQDWRSRLSNADFSVIRGKVYPRSLAMRDLATLLRLFEMLARHDLELSREAERWVEECLRPAGMDSGAGERRSGLPLAGLWSTFGKILTLPYAAGALRAMHRLGFLTALFPEFRAIDALVIRDFYHRYTVDEHSFVAIEKVSALRRIQGSSASAPESDNGWKEKFQEICAELERPELLSLALLFHDVGKGLEGPTHIIGSLGAAEKICAQLELGPADTDGVLFLIAQHMEMSAALRRDIFDSETVRAMAEKVGTPERLKMLCLFTYADVSAVNPEALTPWKAEMLWRLYAMTFNYLSHSLDQDRLRPAQQEAASLRSMVTFLEPGSRAEDLKAFLDGFPRRYLATHSPEEIAGHFRWARRLEERPVYAKVLRRDNFYELTVITRDRPHLFASITGTLAGWSMNILKADAFANSEGIVLDVFRFHDLFRTLELNHGEAARLETQVVDVLSGRKQLGSIVAGRTSAPPPVQTKVKTLTQITFDETSSSRCTLLELVAQDRPGLLYEVSSTLAELGCNIEVALIDTEAQRAIDVFYLTAQGAKLDQNRQQAIRAALLDKLSAKQSSAKQ